MVVVWGAADAGSSRRQRWGAVTIRPWNTSGCVCKYSQAGWNLQPVCKTRARCSDPQTALTPQGCQGHPGRNHAIYSAIYAYVFLSLFSKAHQNPISSPNRCKIFKARDICPGEQAGPVATFQLSLALKSHGCGNEMKSLQKEPLQGRSLPTLAQEEATVVVDAKRKQGHRMWGENRAHFSQLWGKNKMHNQDMIEFLKEQFYKL